MAPCPQLSRHSPNAHAQVVLVPRAPSSHFPLLIDQKQRFWSNDGPYPCDTCIGCHPSELYYKFFFRDHRAADNGNPRRARQVNDSVNRPRHFLIRSSFLACHLRIPPRALPRIISIGSLPIWSTAIASLASPHHRDVTSPATSPSDLQKQRQRRPTSLCSPTSLHSRGPLFQSPNQPRSVDSYPVCSS